ncbi:MAG: hypothetical protein PF505_10040 [Vallitaleaceae bacterium]|jgi:tRNA U54 and U55 pseudouridine synthase Pus10|nr:hypothetical protein [Vallitaleaceae bacterium]
MDNQTQRNELINIMQSMDDCMNQIKRGLDKLDFDLVVKLIGVLTEAFIAVNEFIISDFPREVEPVKQRIETDCGQVNEALEEVLNTFDNHDMELRLGSFDQLKNNMLDWTGTLFDVLELHQ